MQLTLVTGNKGKLNEWQRLLPDDITLENVDINIDEIQSLDLEKIIVDKAKRAYEVIKKPIIVEDVSAGLERLGGLPGPFIKFFLEVLGEKTYHVLSEKEKEKAKVTYIVAYYDGENIVTIKIEDSGTVVSPRGDNGFGFDKFFIPDGWAKTYAQMTSQEKDKISHRSRAIRQLLAKIKAS